MTKGEAIGDLPEGVTREGYTFSHWEVDGSTINSSYVPKRDVTAEPAFDKIEYTISFFVSEEATQAITTKKVDVDTSFCLDDIPSVPQKTGYSAKWVYSGGDFSNTVSVSSDTRVWADYEQNAFTVTWVVEGETYLTEEYNAGDTLNLPGEPTVEGKDFEGWYSGETQYSGGEEVTSDLTITAKFSDEYAVSFIVEGQTQTQYFRKSRETVGSLPEDPFVQGKEFQKWVKEGTETEVTENTVVEESFNAVAVFEEIKLYTITAEYFYKNDNGQPVTFETQIFTVDGHELPYTIKVPSETQTDPDEVATGPKYYPVTPEVTVNLDDFDEDKKYSFSVEYVRYTAVYDIVYKLKDLEGEGYTEIDRKANIEGVLGSYVTPEVKNFDYAVLENAYGATIEQESGQQLDVTYTRKNFVLTYETNGGSYVAGVTAPYGKDVALTATDPTRDGYTFAGWYLDQELTQAAGSTVQLNGDTTVYAKWNGAQVNYTIVYQFEKYNDAGTASSYVYDNSETGHGIVGTTVRATDNGIPDKTRTGWEKDTERNRTSSVVIAADGSSILYVYYKLREYTFNFNAGTYRSGYTNYDVTATLTDKGVTGTGTLDYTMTVKLGQDISSAWPGSVTGQYRTGGCSSWANVSFNGWRYPGGSTYVTKRNIVTPDMLPASGTSITYTAQWTGNANTYTVNYWLQNADDDDYTKSEEYSQTFTSSTGGLSAKEIPGYTYDHGNSGASGTTQYDFYYNRDKFKIDYFHNSDNLKTISGVKFDATITGDTYNWTPTAAQCGVDSDYIWKGWYSDSGLSTLYTFSTMPASNLVLYARWDPPTYTVNFELDGGSPAIEPQTVEKYKKVEKPANPEKEGYTFEGWFTEPEGGGDLFDWNTQIKSDTTIYAHWILKPLTYTVHYLRQEDNVELASDKVVTNPNLEVGEEVTEKALTIAGYRPDEGEKSLELALSGNEITFYYTLKTGTTGYKVFYYVEDTEIPVAEPKNVENVDGNTMSVIELAANVDYDMLYEEHPEYEGQEFFPTDVEKELILAADETKNVIVFYYSPYKSSKITVNFVDMDGNPVHDETTKTVKAGNTFTLARTPVSGWELDKAVEGTSYDGTAAGTTYKITESGVMVFTLFYKKKVTITANSFSRQYNGQPLTLPEDIGGQVTVTGLAQGDSLTSVTFSYVNTDVENGRRNVGTATVTPGNAAFANHGPDYYKVRYLSGTLEVTKVNVTVRIDPDRWTGNIYNGTVYKAGFTSPSKNVEDYITISNETYKTAHLDEIWEAVNSLVDYDASAPGLHYYAVAKTDAGDYSYDIGFTQAMLPVDNNYSVNLAVRSGRLQIRPKELTVTTGSNSKVYDGTPLTKDEATLDGLVEADQDKVTVSATGSQTPVGSSANSYEIAWGNVRSENYTITENLGTLEVTEAELSITIKDASKTYDGSSQKGYDAPATVTGTGSTIETDDYTITGLAEGQKLTISGYTRPSGTDAGTYTNGSFDGAEITITDGEEDVTGYYTVSTTAGKLTITPKAVTVTAQDKEFTYNGTAQSWNKFEVDGLVGDDKITAVVTGSITFPSESPVTNELTSYEFTTGNPDNYTVTTADGELTMTNAEVEITITAASQGWTYDGAAHQNTEVKVTAGELLEGDTLVAEATGSVTNVADTAAKRTCRTTMSSRPKKER